MGVATGFISGGFGTGKTVLKLTATPVTGAGVGTPVLMLEGALSVSTPGAAGFLATKFGVPALQQVLKAQAAGWKTAVFGDALLTSVAHAAGAIPLTAFGAAKQKSRFFAAGVAAARFGTPKAGGILAAEGFQADIKFGLPKAKLKTTGAAAGFLTTNLGSATHPATRFRSMHIPPNARFGTPLLKRVTP